MCKPLLLNVANNQYSLNLECEFSQYYLVFNMQRTTPEMSALAQGIVSMNRNGNFCEGTRVWKIIAATKVGAALNNKKSLLVFLVCL